LRNPATNYIPTLDGWRAIAILLVIFGHGVTCIPGLASWSMVGGHGVAIFFVLSGFLITGKLLEGDSLKEFYIRRAFRIFPLVLAYLGTLIVAGLLFSNLPLGQHELLSSLLFVRNFCFFPTMLKTGAGWFTGHLWSLSVEEQFYLIWPLVLFGIGKKTMRQQITAAVLFFFFGCAVLTVIVVGRTFHIGGWHWLPRVEFGGLFAGSFMRICLSHSWAKAIFTKLSGKSWTAILLLTALILIFHSPVLIADPFLCCLAVGATLCEPHSLFGRLLEMPIMRWIGKLSYSLYIWQQLFTGFAWICRPFGFLNQFPVNIVSIFAISCLSYYLLERPMIRVGHALTNRQLKLEPAYKILASVGADADSSGKVFTEAKPSPTIFREELVQG
jgi:peptidoglycan/LPS O-acetylase OafA/YrhL